MQVMSPMTEGLHNSQHLPVSCRIPLLSLVKFSGEVGNGVEACLTNFLLQEHSSHSNPTSISMYLKLSPLTVIKNLQYWSLGHPSLKLLKALLLLLSPLEFLLSFGQIC